MSARFLMALDAGGGGGHCLLVDVETGAVTRSVRHWSHPAALGTGGLGVDLDLEGVWAALVAAARQALEGAGASAADVAGIAATSMRHTTIVLDAAGNVLLATPNRDSRGAMEALQLGSARGSELYARTGRWPSPQCMAARLQWLAANAPAALARATVVLSLSDWIAYRLCGELASDASQAQETLLFDVARRDWATDVAQSLGVPVRLLPPLRAPGSRLGGLSAAAAAALGLTAGTPVAVGGGDTQCGMLGAGAVRPGQVAVIGGTTVPVQMVIERPLIDAGERLWTGCHVLADAWVLESNAGAMGEALEWLAAVLYPGSATAVAHLLADAAGSEPGAAGIVSTVGISVMNAREIALPIGSLTLSHLATARDPERRRHVARAMSEGLACAVRANLEQVCATAGRAPVYLAFAGGLARSAWLAQLIADIAGRPVAVGASAEATALGAAICAGTAAGVFLDLRDGAERLARPARTLQPAADAAATYAERYEGWQRLRAAQGEANRVASELILPAVLRRLHGPERSVPLCHPRVLVTADMDEASLAELGALAEVEYASFRTQMRLLAGPSLVEALRGVQVLVTEVDVVDAAALAQLPELRAIVSCRGDAVNVDLAACTAFGVPVLHTPGRNAEAVAELTVAFLLMLARRLPAAAAFLHEPGGEAGDMGRMGRAFSSLQGRELGGKTVGLIGFGAVGRAVARRLPAFGARVVVHDPYVAAEDVQRADATPVPLAELLAESDAVSLHAPVTDATRGMLGAAELAQMRPGAWLVNTARAALVNEDALIEALRSERLGGAALDVFAVEPPAPDHPLLRLDRVIATPHVGGNTVDVARHQGRIVVAELRRLLCGQRPLHVLNPDALAGLNWQAPRRTPARADLQRLASRPGPSVTDAERRPAPPPPTAATPAAAPTAAPEAVVEAMRRILAAFTQAVAADERLRAFAQDKDVTLHFTLTDLPLSFFLRLRAGSVASDLGEPDTPAEVELKMPAATLDGMFTGRVNPMQEALGGRLAFRGDTVKAMTLQQVQGELSARYQEARATVGDPGDLAALAAPAGAAPGPAAATPTSGDDVRAQIVRIVHELYEAGMITATGGNVSARIPGRDELWITPGQMFKGDLRPEMLIRLDLDGNVLDEGARSPSSERLMHCAAYRTRPDAQAVIHAHAPHATILADTGLPFVAISTEAAFFADMPRVPFIMPGTEELANAVGAALRDSWAVLMANHGLLVAGRTLRRAADMIEIIDRSAEIILGCHAVGVAPPALPREMVTTLRNMGDLMA